MHKIFQMISLSLGLTLLMCAPVKSVGCTHSTECATIPQGSMCISELSRGATALHIQAECYHHPMKHLTRDDCTCGCLDNRDCHLWTKHKVGSGPVCVLSIMPFGISHCGCHYDEDCGLGYHCSGRWKSDVYKTCQRGPKAQKTGK